MDYKTFEVYAKGLTSTINQADSQFGTSTVMTYKPQNVSEMSAFVAIIRPGCASLLQDFIDRKPYTTGVPELDEILKEGNHRMIYQELIMKYLIWLGIPETGSYDIIKKIAKKKFKEEELAELKEKLIQGWVNRVGMEDGFQETWSVVEDAARYSFNASHSLSYAYDSLYGAYLKSHYPLEYYTVALKYYSGDSERTMRLTDELKYFNIELKPIKFRYSKADYAISRDDSSIYKGIESIKEMNAKMADELYELRDNHYNSFADLLYDISSETTAKKNQIRILIELDYFVEFGDANTLLKQYELFNSLSERKSLKKTELESIGVTLEEASPYAASVTEKLLNNMDMESFLRNLLSKVKSNPRSLKETITAQVEYLGYISIKDDRYKGMAAVVEVDTKYSPKLKLYSLKNGTTLDCKIDKKTFNKQKLEKGDILRIAETKSKPKVKKNEDGEWVSVPGTKELWITNYIIMNNI